MAVKSHSIKDKRFGAIPAIAVDVVQFGFDIAFGGDGSNDSECPVRAR